MLLHKFLRINYQILQYKDLATYCRIRTDKTDKCLINQANRVPTDVNGITGTG